MLLCRKYSSRAAPWHFWKRAFPRSLDSDNTDLYAMYVMYDNTYR